jgi:DNA-binding IclR family transcriptional regulator
MTILGPSQRLTRKRLLEHAVPLRNAAQHVSKALQMG